MLNEILRLCAIFATTFEGFSIFTSNELFQDLIFTPLNTYQMLFHKAEKILLSLLSDVPTSFGSKLSNTQTRIYCQKIRQIEGRSSLPEYVN